MFRRFGVAAKLLDRRARLMAAATLAVNIIAMSPAPAAAQELAEKCRQLAGSPHEPGSNGQGVSFFKLSQQDAVKACRAALAADNVNPVLKYRLARALTKERHYREGFKLAKEAAEQNFLPALDLLAFYYLQEATGYRDERAGLEIVAIALKRGSPEAMARTSELHFSGAQKLKSDEEARSHLLKAAQQEVPQAQFSLASMQLEGRHGFKRDEKAGIQWLERAAAHNHPSAQMNLATFYVTGKFVSRNGLKAKALFEAASLHGIVDASYNLAIMLETGRGVPQDEQMAYMHYRDAADAGHGPSLLKIARLNIRQREFDRARTRLEAALRSEDDLSKAEAAKLLANLQSGEKSARATGDAGAVLGGLLLFALAAAVLAPSDAPSSRPATVYTPPDPCAPYRGVILSRKMAEAVTFFGCGPY